MTDLVYHYSNDPRALIKDLKSRDENYWITRGQDSVFRLFQKMAERVPAYIDFLERHNFNSSNVQGFSDLCEVPIINKENYLLFYPTKELCWDGRFQDQQWVFASTSGSTGEPYYFPRATIQDKQFALTAEITLLEYFKIEKKSTLFVDCFALGVWIGGMFMYEAIKRLIDTGKYPLSIITPGADKVETIKAIRDLASQFDQVILGGYGPLVKDLVDIGIREGLTWEQYDMKYFFAAEGFTESFRDYIAQKTHVDNLYANMLNHYGTADMGTMAHETPVSILIRRLALENPSLYKEIFSRTNKQPTLGQYIPELFFFEEVGGRLVCSSPSGIPLVRYDLKDRGSVLTMTDVDTLFRKHHIDLAGEIERKGFNDSYWRLPFVYVGERDDFTVSIYSVNIYPECIRKALEVSDLQEFLTGKFTMLVDYNDAQNQFLEINIELKHGIEETEEIRMSTSQSIIDWLLKENSEWRDFYADTEIRDKITPRIIYWPYHHPKYFKQSGKQKWVIKSKSK